MTIERRTWPTSIEVRELEGQPNVIEGYAARFDHRSKFMGFYETIKPKAFESVLAKRDTDVRALVNHDWSQVLGRQSAGTLELYEDQRGLRYRVKLPNTTFARDLLESIKRGDVNQSSFGFSVSPEDVEWTEDPVSGDALRSINRVSGLVDVSVVALPAYDSTDVSVAQRSLESWLEKKKSQEGPKLAAAKRRLALALAQGGNR